MWEVEKRGSVNKEGNKSNMIVFFFSFFFHVKITKHHFEQNKNAQNHGVLEPFLFIN